MIPLVLATADDIADHRLGVRLLRQAERAGRVRLGPVLVDGQTSYPADAVGLLREGLSTAASPVTVLSLGAPTALAALLVQTPDLAGAVERVVLLGGAYFAAGDVTPAAERAVYGNPVAYQVVLTSGVRVEMVPLDVSDLVSSALATPFLDDAEPLREISDHAGKGERYAGGRPVRSAAAVLWLLEPKLFTGRDVYAAVETASVIARGVTSVDWWQTTDSPHNAYYLGSIDHVGARAHLDEMMRTLGKEPL